MLCRGPRFLNASCMHMLPRALFFNYSLPLSLTSSSFSLCHRCVRNCLFVAELSSSQLLADGFIPALGRAAMARCPPLSCSTDKGCSTCLLKPCLCFPRSPSSP